MFPVGSVVPALDYRMPAPVESQYHTDQFVSAYDSIADFPDRPDNLFALANSIAGLATGHTAIAFTNPSNVPPQNIRTTVNSRGATTTTYLVPEQHLPLVLPFKYLGYTEDTLNQLDAILMPRVNAGYSRNDDPATAPVQVDPVHGFDPRQSPHRPTRRRSAAAATPFRSSSTVPCPCCPTADADSDFEPTDSTTYYGRDVTPTPQSTILSMLHGRASLRPNDVAFTFTDYGTRPGGCSPRVSRGRSCPAER